MWKGRAVPKEFQPLPPRTWQGTGPSTGSALPTRPSQGEPTSRTVTLPKGILPIEFSLQDVPGTDASEQMYRIIGASGSVIGAQLSYTVPFKGSIVAMGLTSTEAKTAGTATFKAFREGIDTGAALVWATSSTKGFQAFQLGQFSFNAGDSLDVRVTTSSFTPTTADVEAFLYLAQEVT